MSDEAVRDAEKLARRISPVDYETLKITLIPYYAWANRRNPYMKVWLPLPDGNRTARRFDK